MKTCKKCNQTKPFEEFKKDNRNREGAGSPCLECYRKYLESPEQKLKSALRVKTWHEKNPGIRRGDPKCLESYRKYHEKNREKIKEYNKKYIQENREKIRDLAKRHPEKVKAREMLHTQVKLGKIIPYEFCQICNEKTKLQGHHTDYSKPLEVIWLCIPCHKKQHYKYKENQDVKRS